MTPLQDALLHKTLITTSNIALFVTQTEDTREPRLATLLANKLAIAYCGVPEKMRSECLRNENARLKDENSKARFTSRRYQKFAQGCEENKQIEAAELTANDLLKQDLEKAVSWYEKSQQLNRQDRSIKSRRGRNLKSEARRMTLAFVNACIDTSFNNNDQQVVWDEWLLVAWQILNATFDFSEDTENDLDNFNTASKLSAAILICGGNPEPNHFANSLYREIAKNIVECRHKEILQKLKFSAQEAGDSLSLLFWSVQQVSMGANITDRVIRQKICRSIQQLYDWFLPERTIGISSGFDFNVGVPDCLFLELLKNNLKNIEVSRAERYRVISKFNSHFEPLQYTATSPNLGWLEIIYALLRIATKTTEKISNIPCLFISFNDFTQDQNDIKDRNESLADLLVWRNTELTSAIEIAAKLADPLAVYLEWKLKASRRFDGKNTNEAVEICELASNAIVAPKIGGSVYSEVFTTGLSSLVNSYINENKIELAKNDMLSFLSHTLTNATTGASFKLRKIATKLATANSDTDMTGYSRRLASQAASFGMVEDLVSVFKLYTTDPDILRQQWDADTGNRKKAVGVCAESIRQALLRFYFSQDYEVAFERFLPETRYVVAAQEFIDVILPLDFCDDMDIKKFFVWIKTSLPFLQVVLDDVQTLHLSGGGAKSIIIYSIIGEFVSNALKYAVAGNPICLQLATTFEGLSIQCRNSVDKNSNTNSKSRGKGLSFIRRICDLIGAKFSEPFTSNGSFVQDVFLPINLNQGI